MSRFQFVADHQHTFEVKRLCEIVEVSRSSFYAWVKAGPRPGLSVPRRTRRWPRGSGRSRTSPGHRAYGAPRMTAELNDGTTPMTRTGEPQAGRPGHARARHRWDSGCAAGCAPPSPSPTDQKVPDLLKRDFTAAAPNNRYVGDITYLPCVSGRPVPGHGDRLLLPALVGWSIADHMRTELVEDALRAAQLERGSLVGAVFHSDHGGQYTSKEYAELCDRSRRDPLDGGRRVERRQRPGRVVQRGAQTRDPAGAARWAGARDARLAAFKWITRYNTRRRHSYCGQLSPVAYERAHPPLRCNRLRSHQIACPLLGEKAPDLLRDLGAAARLPFASSASSCVTDDLLGFGG